ncbi:MAG: hypothetical protein ABIS51_01660 [Sphingomonas sp.]
MRNALTAIIALATAWAVPVHARTAPAPAPAQDAGGGIMDKAVNKIGANWSFYGPNQTSKMMKDAAVTGGQFVRVKVTAKGANVWDVGAISPIQKPIAAGDTVLVAIWMRGPELKDGETMPLPLIGANAAAAPYTNLVASDVKITNAWKLYYASGKASTNFPGNSANVTVHLASDKHVVDLGPVIVLDFGQNYTAKLPDNNDPQ